MSEFLLDLQIPEELKARLQLQTHLLHEWAQQRPEPFFEHENRDAAVGRFGIRMDTVARRGLFLAGGQPGQDPILPMQAKLAYTIHGLRYDTKLRRWAPAVEPSEESARRGDGYLIRLWQNNAKYPPPPDVIHQKSIPKVDMALIAHCFQTPVQIWEAWDDELFEFWLTRIQEGRNLFAYDAADYLLDYAVPSNDLVYFVPTELRAAVIEAIELPRIPSNVRLGFSFDLPPAFERAEAMLFEFDHAARQLSLISTHGNTDGSLLFERTFRVPRTAGPNSTAGTRFGESERSDFLLLLIKPGAVDRKFHQVSGLGELGFYSASTLQAARSLTTDEVDRLRTLLFRLPPQQWRLFKKTVEIRPGEI
jgi:hypothetical protein